MKRHVQYLMLIVTPFPVPSGPVNRSLQRISRLNPSLPDPQISLWDPGTALRPTCNNDGGRASLGEVCVSSAGELLKAW
jgi:hypothetical protein